MVQEIHDTNLDIHGAGEAGISGYAAKVEADIAEAMKHYRIRAARTALSLMLHGKRLCKVPSFRKKQMAARLSSPRPSITSTATSSVCSNR